MNFTKYAVGEIIENFKGKDEGIQFDISDTGAVMLVYFNSPTEREIQQFKATERFEMRFTVLRNIIMITAKIGNLAWIDAPYSPHLSLDLTKLELPQDEQGLSITLILVDCKTGEIKSLRLIGLSTNFSKKLIGAVMEEQVKPFDIAAYQSNLQAVYSSYTTKDIVNLSKDYCKIN